jgi:hypothetical protein
LPFLTLSVSLSPQNQQRAVQVQPAAYFSL